MKLLLVLICLIASHVSEGQELIYGDLKDTFTGNNTLGNKVLWEKTIATVSDTSLLKCTVTYSVKQKKFSKELDSWGSNVLGGKFVMYYNNEEPSQFKIDVTHPLFLDDEKTYLITCTIEKIDQSTPVANFASLTYSYHLKKEIGRVYSKVRLPLNYKEKYSAIEIGQHYKLQVSNLNKYRTVLRLDMPVAWTSSDTAVPYLSDTVSDCKPGRLFRLKNINFVADKHLLKLDSMHALDTLFTFLTNRPGLRISIEGHVCCVPAEDAYDDDTHQANLSINRAKAVYDYLIERGIVSGRLSYKGLGTSHPIIPDEKTEADALKNRRVEIRIVE